MTEGSDILGSIYMWIPRFAINTETNNIKYIPAEMQIGENWTTPNMFIYPIENETKPDLSLTGIWVEKDIDTNYSSTITQMNQEESIYGFLANTKATQITTNDINSIQTYIDWFTNTQNPVGNDAPVVPLDDISNPNRIILQITNTNIVEPIKAKATYNETQGKIEIQVTYSKNGIAKIIDQEGKILSENSLTADTGNKELEKSTYSFTVIDNKNNKKECSIKLSGIIPQYYGAIVNNYTCPEDGETDITWRVFHKDEEGKIYLIADDYIPYTSLPTSTTGIALTNGLTNYCEYFTDILNDYTGSEWIKENTNENAQKWLSKYLTKYPTSTNDNMKAVAYMMDTDVWGKKFAGNKAEYAIGGPTLELFCESYKVTHPDRYIECDSVMPDGYQVKWSDGVYANFISNLTQNDFNKIYINSDKTKAYAMWLASPSAFRANCVVQAHCTSQVHNTDCDTFNLGFRPIVCLNSGTELQNNGDGTYDIVSGAETNVINMLKQPFELAKTL